MILITREQCIISTAYTVSWLTNPHMMPRYFLPNSFRFSPRNIFIYDKQGQEEGGEEEV